MADPQAVRFEMDSLECPRKGNQIAAEQVVTYLENVGVEVIFGLCGHTVVQMLDALSRSRIRFITTRHEQLAAHAADGYARASGKPGVVLLHVGPGLTNSITGLANAALDSIPLVAIAGDVQSYYHGRHPHQEVNIHLDGDQFELCRPFCKRIYRVGRAEDLPRIMERAFYLSQAGRPGPVLVDVPMDFFSADLPVGAFNLKPSKLARPAVDSTTAEYIARELASARRPVIFAGGGVHLSSATAELAALAETLEIPVAHSLMGKGALPDSHPLLAGATGYWGTPIANELCRTADLILAVGTRFGETDCSSWDPAFTFDIPPTTLIHIDIDPTEIGRNYPAELGVVADAKQALSLIVNAAKTVKVPSRPDVRARIAAGRAEFASNWSQQRTSDEFPMRPERILADVRKALPDDGYIVTDVGWNKNGVGQQFPINVPGTFITPGGLATMGFGHAAALGVKYAKPDRPVLALVGDGCFSNNMSVVATAVEARLPVVWVVMDNASFGVIGNIENRHLDNRFGTTFEVDGKPLHVDYAAVAEASGARGVMIRSAAELEPAIRSALKSGVPTVIQVRTGHAPTPTPGHWDINNIIRKPNAH
jgi:acetolactate synthase I/II/III large subunit